MKGKRSTSGGGRAARVEQSKGGASRDLAARLRDERERKRDRGGAAPEGLTRKEVAAALGWSESRLVSYESGSTQPNVLEIQQLADYYVCDAAWLAFGSSDVDDSPVASKAHGLLLPRIGGGRLSVPESLVAGVTGPLACAVVGDHAGFGLSRGDVLVVQTKAAPAPGALWVVRHGEELRAAWIVSAARTGVQVRLGIAGAPVAANHAVLVGRVVATMQRTEVSVGGVLQRAWKK
jgi:transcriptional regulator with XRE-family HTH domain